MLTKLLKEIKDFIKIVLNLKYTVKKLKLSNLKLSLAPNFLNINYNLTFCYRID